MATGTVMPSPKFTGWDSNGDPLNAGKLYSYIAGTSTLLSTYTDVGLTVANTNPVILDSAGRATVFLSPGLSYKFILQDSASGAVWTQDNVSATPASAGNLDLTGTAGEALTAGQAVYCSDGSGSKTVGLWYKADSAALYSSASAVVVGFVPSSIVISAAGTIRVAGQATGLTSLTIGSTYYVGTAGAITTTQPTNARVLGIADTTSTLIMAANPGIPLADNSICDFRLSLTTAVPVTTADVTAATTLFCTPYRGNRIALFDAAGNAKTFQSAQMSIAIPATVSQMYDVFAYDSSGTPTLELLAWTNDTTRATALVQTTTGAYTKTADLTRRYLGSVRTTTVSGQTEDSFTKRYVWNYYNRVPRGLLKLYGDASWTYSTATLRQANANAANQLDLIVGIAEAPVSIQLTSQVLNDTGGMLVANGIGYDSTSAMLTGSGSIVTAGLGLNVVVQARVEAHYPAVGRHTYVGLEWSTATGSTTWYGTTGQGGAGPTGINSGLRGFYLG